MRQNAALCGNGLTTTLHQTLSSDWLLSHTAIVKTIISHKRANYPHNHHGKNLKPFPNKPWGFFYMSALQVCLKRAISPFPVFFNPFGELAAILIKLKSVGCKLFQFGKV